MTSRNLFWVIRLLVISTLSLVGLRALAESSCDSLLEADIVFRLDDLALTANDVWWRQDLVPLTPVNKRVLVALANRPDQVVGQQTITDEVWPDRDFSNGTDPAVDISVAVLKIRRAFAGVDTGFNRLLTFNGRGYMWQSAIALRSKRTLAGVTLNDTDLEVEYQGQVHTLTKAEFLILDALLSAYPAALSRSKLAYLLYRNSPYGADFEPLLFGNTVRVIVSRLRTKLSGPDKSFCPIPKGRHYAYAWEGVPVPCNPIFNSDRPLLAEQVK